MKKPLKHHITELEKRVQQLSQEMMQNGKTLDERNRLESELRVAQQALEHFQQAITLEAKLQRQ
jgi:predicted  nucleic acid-binding Zn-ribbon protein